VIAVATFAMGSAGSAGALWYFTRGFGAAALVMLTLVTVLGVLTSVRWTPPRVPRFVVDGLHRNVALASIVFIAVHVVTAVSDGFAPIGWLDAVIPLRSEYRPVWLGLGAVAADLLLAVGITSIARLRLGHRAWRLVHWLAYACWPIALVHGIGTGSDGVRPAMIALDAIAFTTVLAAVLWRLAVAGPGFVAIRAAGALTGASVVVAVFTWTIGGPMQSGWARAAGTPERLLAQEVPTVDTIEPFTAVLDGSIHQGDPTSDGRLRLEIRADVSRAQPLVFDAVLEGYTGASGGLAVRRGAVELGPDSDPALYRGALTSLEGGRLGAFVTAASGDRLDLDVTLMAGDSADAVTGEIRVESGSASSFDDERAEADEGLGERG